MATTIRSIRLTSTKERREITKPRKEGPAAKVTRRESETRNAVRGSGTETGKENAKKNAREIGRKTTIKRGREVGPRKGGTSKRMNLAEKGTGKMLITNMNQGKNAVLGKIRVSVTERPTRKSVIGIIRTQEARKTKIRAIVPTRVTAKLRVRKILKVRRIKPSRISCRARIRSPRSS